MPQKYAFFSKLPRKPQEICKLSANYHKTSTSTILSTFPHAVPARTTWRRPLMVRQPYSAAVPSTGGRLHPSLLRREGLVRMWSPLWKEGRGDSKRFLIFKNSDAKVKTLCIKALCRNGDMLTPSFSTPPHHLSPPRSRSPPRRASFRGSSAPCHRQRDGG